ncbi:MAG: UDP-N-acetylmuramate--L-alanine ligase [Candidatus Brocadia sp. AMX2]|uniref:UDP-N-acetylmuramate--L-alanine ligase n=1 Tax=Candidatus Brocadia sinica JPN1 TaxID=1197129 RepID=A0ABQ0K2R0_9BACT|nr:MULTISPECIES: UDP-N-acetylmuramate--L-alanine ligase [Brocadia]KXK27538.1 MAG: UDP-N-acetylmuramate:L-alanine ligase [Candidatus Brocadia sinica]MBC6933713.1 UDP-N-acetylmuramate--L-alanine ligase [Candidatus Brocadia sp.]MBL1168741.1 UDP-N-acetylmuramate--L-alanine ligase [Candidatus Brocadia sp. AMX1]NOG42800.1 UDP-N-acetylmuramate--L-alanine ligase [Planctomycetota bacterium]KAA0242985.1 MAG: UDP-N-acetylmuramate--L-alanine ligase [Candidatus Brocadia sp. AMX2]
MKENCRDFKKFSYHFVGVGGIGMSAIAQVLREKGHIVSGSDRNYDKNITDDVFSKLFTQGISLHPQDGSGVKENTDCVVVSSAIEEDNPDIKKARLFYKKITKRADLLAEMFNPGYGIAIGGTNGKTTVSCMVGYILDYAGLSPTIIVGGCIKNFANNSRLGNAKTGDSDIISIEADESDGSIALYTPRVSVITNISKDHKTIEEISKMFITLSQNTGERLILNADCPYLKMIDFQHKDIVTYGLNNNASICAKNIAYKSFQSTFTVDDQSFEINLPGSYNVSNALAAIAVARSLGISDSKTAAALREFRGVQRRMDIIGEINGIKIIDDYAHNPEKVKAAIHAVKLGCKRVIAIFQPHGYSPTNFMKEEFIDAFTKVLSPNDILFMPEIFYAGGTASKNISSADIVKRISKGDKNAFFIERRDDIIPFIDKQVSAGDCILVMGARDNTLTEFCQKIFQSLVRLSEF